MSDCFQSNVGSNRLGRRHVTRRRRRSSQEHERAECDVVLMLLGCIQLLVKRRRSGAAENQEARPARECRCPSSFRSEHCPSEPSLERGDHSPGGTGSVPLDPASTRRISALSGPDHWRPAGQGLAWLAHLVPCRGTYCRCRQLWPGCWGGPWRGPYDGAVERSHAGYAAPAHPRRGTAPAGAGTEGRSPATRPRA
jgi:hypothetical protein